MPTFQQTLTKLARLAQSTRNHHNQRTHLESVQINTQITIVFFAYALLMLYIGFYFFRKNRNSEDYFLGGRGMGPIVSALSAGASDMSGWLLMGLPGALYVSGFVESYIAIGLTLGATANWTLVARRLRTFTHIFSDITIADFFESRFDDGARHTLRLVCAAVTLVFFTFYVSSGLVAGAKLFETTFGVGYTFSLVVGTLIIVTYTFLGGYKAVCWTDLIQGLLMMGALIAVPLAMIFAIGGVGEAAAIIRASKPEMLNFGLIGGGVSGVAVISALAWGLGYFGQPHILVRFISIRSVKDVPTATLVGISWMAVSLIGACAMGVVGYAFVTKFGVDLRDPERIFIVMSQSLFTPWVTGILLSAILAAIMSTASSQLLVSSSTIAEDFYKHVMRRDAAPAVILRIGRVGVLAVAGVAFWLAMDENSSVLKIVSYAWAGFGASFGSVMIFALFWRRMTRGGAVAGMVAGAVAVVVWKNLVEPAWGFGLYEIVPGFAAACVAIVAVSLAGRADERVVARFDKMVAALG